jgi:hypothetical protein
MLERAGHVADVRRRPEQDAVRLEQVRGAGRQGRPRDQLDPVHERDTLTHRFQHRLHGR